MLGQPVYFLTPDVVGVHLTGALARGRHRDRSGADLTQMLRKAKVVGKFVEFYGPGAAALPVVDRATIANMAPEYGATMGFFPIDGGVLDLPPRHGPHRGARRACTRPTTGRRACGACPQRAQIDYSQDLELDLGDRGPERRRARSARRTASSCPSSRGSSPRHFPGRSPRAAMASGRRPGQDGPRPSGTARHRRRQPGARVRQPATRREPTATEREMTATGRPGPGAPRRRDRPRQRADRRHHQLHQHLQSRASCSRPDSWRKRRWSAA